MRKKRLDAKCRTCRYGRQLTDFGDKKRADFYCDYMRIMGNHRRPCAPGDECTVYVRKKRGDKRGILDILRPPWSIL